MRRYALPAAAALLALALGTAGASHIAMNNLQLVPAERMDVLAAIPSRIGEWNGVPMIVEPVQPSLLDALGRPVLVYDKVETRSFRKADGTTIMLMLAYQREQHQEDRVHVPDLCYFAQGYVLSNQHDIPLKIGRGLITARGFTAEGLERREQVLYWIRTGDLVNNSALRVRAEIFRQGLSGRLLDGLLVRASIVRPAGHAVSAEQDEADVSAFLSQLVLVSSPALAKMLTGTGSARSDGVTPG